MLVKRLSVLLASSALAFGVAAGPAFGWCDHNPPPTTKKQKCNSGNGNGSDPITFNQGDHCYGGDPGNSFKNNRGGDEIPTSGGNPNPGGNNVD